MAVAEVVCPAATISNSVLEDTSEFGDNAEAAFVVEWFVDYGAGDLHLSPMPSDYPVEIISAAIWQTGDPSTDIDGDPRPMTDGSPDFAGADLIIP